LAPPGRASLKVTLPLMLPGIGAGALLSFIKAINEPSSTLVLYVDRTMTMPVRIHLSVLDGEFGTAAALTTILLATTGIAVFIDFETRTQRKARLPESSNLLAAATTGSIEEQLCLEPCR
jgi:iron(III) transport system permease protein